MTSLSHQNLIKISSLCGLKTSAKGHCAGIAVVGGLSFLHGKTIEYIRINRLIAQIFETEPTHLACYSIRLIPHALSVLRSISVTQLPETRRFFKGEASTVCMRQFTRKFFSEITSKISFPPRLETDEHTFIKDYLFSLTLFDVVIFLKKLSETFTSEGVDKKVLCIFNTCQHAISFGYDPTQRRPWVLNNDAVLGYRRFSDFRNLAFCIIESFPATHVLNTNVTFVGLSSEQTELRRVMDAWEKTPEIIQLARPNSQKILRQARDAQCWMQKICLIEDVGVFETTLRESISAGFDINARDCVRNGIIKNLIEVNEGELEKIQIAVRYGADIESQDIYGTTALMAAMDSNYEQIISFLLSLNPSVDGIDYLDRLSILEKAVRNKSHRLLRVLLQHRANPNLIGCCGKSPIFFAILLGDLEAMKILIEFNASLDIRSALGCSPLNYAITHGTTETLEFLLQHGADPNHISTLEIRPVDSQRFCTPIENAVFINDPVKLELLFRYGADINFYSARERILLDSIAVGSLEVTKILVSHGADLAAVDFAGQTPFLLACALSKRDQILFLLDKSNLSHASSQTMLTPLHYLVASDDYDLLEIVLKSRANPSMFDNLGNTPIFVALYKSNFQAIDILIKYGVPLSEKNQHGETLLHVAVKEGSFEMVHFLLARGLDPNMLSHVTSPLYRAAMRNELDKIELLLQFGAYANDVYTINYAIKAVNIGVINLLLKYGLDANVFSLSQIDYLKEHFQISRYLPLLDLIYKIEQKRG